MPGEAGDAEKQPFLSEPLASLSENHYEHRDEGAGMKPPY